MGGLSKGTVERRLRPFTNRFGARLMQSLETQELEAWRLTLTPGWRAPVFQETRRMLDAWKRWQWISANPSDGIRNRAAKAAEVIPVPWDTLLALEDEIDKRYLLAPVLGGGTGLRPEEYLALEWRDVDLSAGVVYVRRVWSRGRLIELGADGSKTHRQRRRVPLRRIVADRLADWPRRLDTRLLLPAPEGGHMSTHQFRERFWRPAFTCAGLPYQRPYDMRHTYAAESIAAGVNLFDLSRFMGTSLKQIDRTYGHLVADSEHRNRELLDAYDQARAAER
jgi:integrase